MINEEMYEKRLEMYEKSVKKPRKRPHIETVDTDDEFVSSLLLHAEQSKVQVKSSHCVQTNQFKTQILCKA